MQRLIFPRHFPKHFSLVALFILPPALLLAIGESYIRQQPNPSKFKHAFLTKHSRNVDILILGSSHTYYGIAPEILSPNAFSLAQVSQTLKYDCYLLHHYVFSNLQTVILPISDFTLYEDIENGSEWYMANRYRLYMECDLHPKGSVYDWEITAFASYCNKLKQLWTPTKMVWSRQGQGLEYTLESRPQPWDNGTQRARHNHYDNLEHASVGMSLLSDIEAFCSRRNVQLILISTPLSCNYRHAQDQKQVKDTERHLRAFIKSHPHVSYLDYRSHNTFTANDFYDADHLNRQGAYRLTREIAKHIKGLQKASQPF